MARPMSLGELNQITIAKSKRKKDKSPRRKCCPCWALLCICVVATLLLGLLAALIAIFVLRS